MPETQSDDASTNEAAQTSDTSEAGGEIDYKAEYEKLLPQYKGLQRTASRLQTEMKSRLKGEEALGQIGILTVKVDTILDAFDKSGFTDQELAAKIKTVKTQTAQAGERLRAETTALEKIADITAETGVDFSSIDAAQAYWDSGNLAKAVEVYEKAARKPAGAADIQKQVDLLVEQKLRELGKGVDGKTGTTATSKPKSVSERIAKVTGSREEQTAELWKIAEEAIGGAHN